MHLLVSNSFISFFAFDISGFDDFKFCLMKRAIPRSLRYLPTSPLPITVDMLRNICRLCDKMGKKGKTFKALCLVGFNTLARLSFLVPVSAVNCDLSRTVQISDLCAKNYGFNLIIKWTKVQQLLQDKLVIPLIKRTEDLEICPVLALSDLIGILPAGVSTSAPLFQWEEVVNGRHTTRFFTINSARICLRSVLRALGFSPLQFSFHSFRRGGCQFGYIKGVSVQDLKFLGGWSSDAINRYLPVEQATLRAASALANS